MSFLKKVTPVNLLSEKEKFFADQTYNPQFKYEGPVPEEILHRYGKPNRRINDLAQTIVDQAFYHKSSSDLENDLGPLVSQKEVTHKIKQFLKMHQIDKRYSVIWSKSFIARTSITARTIKLRLPSTYRNQSLIGMLYHEIGTHAIRRVNYEQQPWFKKKTEYRFANYLQTEEGLAGLHSLLPVKNKLAYRPALSYLAASYAQTNSFASLWHLLGKYIDDPNERWIKTVRQKRGLTDTSLPGGFTKDIVYFAGMIDVWNYLNKNDFNIKKLYFGKIAHQDVDAAFKANPTFKPILPSFYAVDQVKYQQQMQLIGKTNLFL